MALFENPPARSDPLLFQIEDLDPIRDNRTPRRLFRQEPYDPVGIQIGSFVLFPELELGGSYYSNVFHAPSAKSDVALDVLPSARLVSNWGRHALEFRAIGALSFYNEFQTEDDKDYLLEARGRLDITRRANIQALISQPADVRGSLGARCKLGRNPCLRSRRIAPKPPTISGSIACRCSFAAASRTIPTAIPKTPASSRTIRIVTTRRTKRPRARPWELKPTLSPFVEVAVNQREYGEAAQTDLINRIVARASAIASASLSGTRERCCAAR